MRVVLVALLALAVVVSAMPIEDAGADVDEAASMEPTVRLIAPLDVDTRLLAAQSVRFLSATAF